jgi:hypothetical protein
LERWRRAAGPLAERKRDAIARKQVGNRLPAGIKDGKTHQERQTNRKTVERRTKRRGKNGSEKTPWLPYLSDWRRIAAEIVVVEEEKLN